MAVACRHRASCRASPADGVAANERVALDIVLAATGDGIQIESAMHVRSNKQVVRGRLNDPGGFIPGGARRGTPAPPPARPPGPATVSGRIVDADSKPVSGVEVRTMRWIPREGGSVLANFGAVGRTDADGRYRLAGRQPGEYLLVASKYPFGGFETTHSLMPAPVEQADGQKLAYQTTFFPGTVSGERATPILLDASERTGVDFVLARMPVVDVTGTVGPSTLAVAMSLVPVNPLDSVHTRRLRPEVDGTFRIPDVPAGAYEIHTNGPSGWARTSLEIVDRAPAPVAIVLQRRFRVSGRVEFRGSQPHPTAAELKQMELFNVSLRPAIMGPGSSANLALIAPDGRFSLSASGPGHYLLQARSPAPWIQETGMIDGRDTIDLPVEITGDVSNALIVIGDRLTSLLGQVQDERGEPASSGVAVVFTDDAQYWTRLSRRVQLVTVKPGGTFIASGMPSGTYRVFVSRDLRETEPITPALLTSLTLKATTFVLEAGQQRKLQLTLQPR